MNVRLKTIKYLYFVIILIIIASTVFRILFLHIDDTTIYISYLPERYSDAIKFLLDKPIYLEEHFKQEKVNNHDQLGNFGLLWNENRTQLKCYITDDIHYTQIQKATSGILFSGDKFRTFNKTRIRFKGKSIMNHNNIKTRDGEVRTRFNCSKWGVVTTIFDPPSEAVRRFLYRKNWCVVVVGDKGTHTEVRMFLRKK